MLKKWKKTLKVLATIFVLLIYVTKTIELYGSENLKSESSKRDLNIETEFSTASDRYSGTIKTIVGYSREFRVRKELQDQIECEQVGDRPDSKTSNATSSWKHDRKLGIRAFSAYYDQRQEPYRYVRIIGLIPRNLSLYCQVM